MKMILKMKMTIIMKMMSSRLFLCKKVFDKTNDKCHNFIRFVNGNYYEKADRMKGMTGENLMILLESRLDNVIFRAGFARTRREARQMVDHKFFLVNGKCVNIPSYLIKAGDVIEVKEKCRSTQRIKDVFEVTDGRLTPNWMEADHEAFKVEVKSLPTREEIDVPVDEMLIVELYSK